MNREKLYDRIMLEHRNLIQIHKRLYEAQHLPPDAAPDEVTDLLTDAALLAEKTTCRLRNLLFDTAPTPRPDYFSRAAVEQGISVTYRDGIFRVRLPRLLPKKRQKSSAAFLLLPLQAALDGFCKTHPFPLYDHCVVCIEHVYDAALPHSQMRDYDNLQLKPVLDMVALYTMQDDSGSLCDLYQTSRLEFEPCTRVTVLPPDAFPHWLESHKNSSKTLSENRPILPSVSPTTEKVSPAAP